MNKEDFVKVWNESASAKEVSDRTGYTYYSVTSKASYLRGEGYDVKKFIPPREYFQRIGAIGGKNGTTGGFWHSKHVKGDDSFARKMGAKGGKSSKRSKV